MTVADFIARWSQSGGAEIANSQSFLKELCTLLDVPQPDPTQADEARNTYTFEKAVKISNGDGSYSDGRLDLYRQGCFVLESKQGTEQREAELEELLAEKSKAKKGRKGHAQRGTSLWVNVMQRARKQAERYAQAIPGEWPPFLMVVDVGHCIQLYADFTQSGKNYQPFPDPQSFQIWLRDLEREDIRNRLQTIWLEPLALDPSRHAAKVTRKLAEKLAKLAKSMEGKHPPATVANFLMRCLFTMFVEDMEIGGFQTGDFTKLLHECRSDLARFVPMLEGLWSDMNTGQRMSGWIRKKIMQFNGGLFEDVTALPVTPDQLELLIESAEADWREVEPAIFGTLLERALDPVERHKLGAHYTPRAYVERLVMPTIIEPLREEWATVYATATALTEEARQLREAGDKLKEKSREQELKFRQAKTAQDDAVAAVRNFHQQLCETTVLDPACGSGNFLYVSLELMKRLEGEVLNTLKDLGDKQQVLITIDPHQFLGIEVNPRAAAITDLVLWIGYLQWHARTHGKNAPLKEPIIRKFRNVECRDAVLAWDAIEDVFDEQGNPVTRWDGRTTKPHPVTGEEVPDETARVQEKRYINPRKAEWPKADYIVGNPPFIGTKRMRFSLGDGYVHAIRSTYEAELQDNADYVMFWWWQAATQIMSNRLRRFGFITTNSITQSFNRRVIEPFLLEGLRLIWAIPDHPWTDDITGADVRIAMTVASLSVEKAFLCYVTSEQSGIAEVQCVSASLIHADLRIGADVASCTKLVSNQKICSFGMALHGAGFILSPTEAALLRNDRTATTIRPYLGGRDLMQERRERYVVDFSFLSKEEAIAANPAAFQRILDRVYPERKENRRKSIRELWWRYGWERPELTKALRGLSRYLSTTETSKHRVFQFVPIETVPDHMVVVFASDDGYHHGVVSSRPHAKWALAAGGRLGVGNDPRYNKTRCFDPFPFPDPDEATKQRIRELGEQLDAHRKRQQALHPDLTMTGMYNVLEKLPSGEALSKKEQIIHEQGLVSVLKQIHDDLDAAVFAAYGWPPTLTDEEILERLVDLNHQRAAEEAQGHIRWLRPDFQNPQGNQPQKTQGQLLDTADDEEPDDTTQPTTAPAKVEKAPWPKSLPERIKAVRDKLTSLPTPTTAADLAKGFKGGKATTVEELLETLVTVGQATKTTNGRYGG